MRNKQTSEHKEQSEGRQSEKEWEKVGGSLHSCLSGLRGADSVLYPLYFYGNRSVVSLC